MKLKEYLRTKPGEQKLLAAALGVSRSQMSQMVSGLCHINEKRCVFIEEFTKGNVSRKDLRPNDWYEIWPELATQEQTESEVTA